MNNQEINTLLNNIEEVVDLLEADLVHCDNPSQSELLKSEMDLFTQAMQCIKYLQGQQQSAWVYVADRLPDVGRKVVCLSMNYDPDLPTESNYWVDVRDICVCKQSFRDDDDLTHCREIVWQGKAKYETEFLWSYLPTKGVQKWKNPTLQPPLNHEKVIVAFEKDGETQWATGVFYAYDNENPSNKKCNFFKVYQRENNIESGQWRDDIDVIAWTSTS